MTASGSLLSLQLQGVIDTDIVVGDGSYATVKQLDFRGLKCVGKKLHALLFRLANPREKTEMLQRFTVECELLSQLHHPCIVQFLGVYFEQGSQIPVLVMEYLLTNLSSCLEKYGILPEEISYPILRDAALGLRYLHESVPPIIHRDLSANNILLTADMNAKISDLGVAKILNLSPAQITQRISTQTPGTPCYMPPEALVSKPAYTSKIDNYSYGVLVIHCLCGRWPFPAGAFRDDSNNPGTLIPVSEFERRGEYLVEIGMEHPLVGLIQRCLSNTPSSRPEASEILQEVEEALSNLPSPVGNKIEMIRQIKAQAQGSDVQDLRAEVESQKRKIEVLEKELESTNRENENHRKDIETLKEKLQQIGAEAPLSLSKKPDDREPLASVPPLTLEPPHLTTPIDAPEEAATHTLPPGNKDSQLHLCWRECSKLPIKMANAQTVLIGTKVYVGGGNTDRVDEQFVMCCYEPTVNEWEALPPCPVRWFGLGQFQGHLVTVGGDTRQGVVTGKVYQYSEESRKWNAILKPMPTARYYLSVVTTESAVVACGGTNRNKVKFANVEIYTAETEQWHSADSLPIPCYYMTSVTIGDTCYLLGGNGRNKLATKCLLAASISALIQRACKPKASVAGKVRDSPVWKTLPPVPLLSSSATTHDGYLLAIGGCDNEYKASPAIHMLLPQTNSWARMDSDDLPAARYASTAIELSGGRDVLVCGGYDQDRNVSKAVYIGTVSDS